MIVQETTPELINRISNMPEVLPFLSRHGEPLDWSPAFQPESNCMVLSNGEDACMFFERAAPRDWQVNTMYAPSCRKEKALETGLAMKAFMIPDYADLIFGSIPKDYGHAIRFYEKLGGEMMESIESGGFIWTAQPGEVFYALRSS